MTFISELFTNFRAFLRFFLFVFCISGYFVSAIFVYAITFDPEVRRHRLTENGARTARLIASVFNIEILCPTKIQTDEHCLLVGNHLGFIDIVCLIALQPAVFITSLEMKQTPVLGQICDLGGCAYVNRKSRISIQDELKDIVDVLKKGFRVVLYAESVASNGEQVLPFKKTLMTSAGYAGVPIRPFVFNVTKVNGGPVKFEHRDAVCWYGDQSFFAAVWRSLKLDSLTCQVDFLPLVNVSPDEDRTALAHKVHSMVSAKFQPFYAGMNADERVSQSSQVSAY